MNDSPTHDRGRRPRRSTAAVTRGTRAFAMMMMLLLFPFSIAPPRLAHAQKVPSPVVPDGDPKAVARAEVQKAQVHYKLGRFDQALEAYSRAYEMFSAPALLFNIGQCHRNLKNYERALFFFEGYLREETKADAQKRTLAQQLIAEARAELERQRTAAAAAEAESRRAAAATAAATRPGQQDGQRGSDQGSGSSSSSVAAVFGAPKAPPSGVPNLLEDTPTAEADEPITRKWWFWTALGVGAAGLAAGVLTYYATAPTTTVLPGGSVGTLDRR